MEAKFKVGDSVKAKSFTNCFGKLVAEVPGLTVTKVTLIAPDHMGSYYRVMAHEADGLGYVEGAETFFEVA